MAASAACALRHQGGWQAQGFEGLVQSLCRPLRLAPVTLKAFMRLEAPALSGCGLLFGLSFVGGHRGLRLTVLLARHGKKGTMSPKELACKNLHGPHPFPRVVGPLNRDKEKSEAWTPSAGVEEGWMIFLTKVSCPRVTEEESRDAQAI